ncbi:hypothetical protein CRUP_005309 [Coryphaenoides rupestris]|nr:hypothetical protein CRUP_005309 [Coryphaenoides rupestris]
MAQRPDNKDLMPLVWLEWRAESREQRRNGCQTTVFKWSHTQPGLYPPLSVYHFGFPMNSFTSSTIFSATPDSRTTEFRGLRRRGNPNGRHSPPMAVYITFLRKKIIPTCAPFLAMAQRRAHADQPEAGSETLIYYDEGNGDAGEATEYLAEGSEHIFRTHTCPKCRRCFKMRSHLREHLRIHFPSPSLQCPTCQHFFTSKSKLRVHMLREAGHKVHRCHRCDYSAVERNAVRRHLANVHGDDDTGGGDEAEVTAGDQHTPDAPTYPCPTCGQTFQQSRSLKAHMKTHNVPLGRQEALSCFQEGCPFRGSGRKDLLRHAMDTHGVVAAVCRHHACNAVFATEMEMEVHWRSHQAYHCPQCDFSCSNKSVFLRHQRQGHAGGEELRCDFCAFVTFNPVAFQQHVGHLHASEKIHQCPQCSYVTAHKRGLNRHMLMHSGEEEDDANHQCRLVQCEKPHKCSKCDFRCRDESYLAKHMLTHSDDKNFMCSECGYVTKWKHYLNVHMRKHSEYLVEGSEHIFRTHTCPKCRRCFKMRSHLREHLRIHFPSPGLQCPTCQRFFTSKSKLRVHMLREAGHKVHRCDYSAVERNAVCRHLANVHGDDDTGGGDEAEVTAGDRHTPDAPTYPCPTCGQTFQQSRSLKAHMKTHNVPPGRQEALPCFQEGCPFRGSGRKDLLRHAMDTHGVAAAVCRHHACNAVFTTEMEMEMEVHWRSHQAYHCPQCDFSWSNKSVFQQQGHARGEELCCDFCAFVTFNPVAFQQHVGHLHASEKIQCPQCSYVTAHRLNRHMLMHSGEEEEDDANHQRRLVHVASVTSGAGTSPTLPSTCSHTDDKNFMCSECGYVTKWKHYLNVHSGDLRYECDQCPYRCHRADQLNSHKLRHQAKSLMCEICAYACKRK